MLRTYRSERDDGDAEHGIPSIGRRAIDDHTDLSGISLENIEIDPDESVNAVEKGEIDYECGKELEESCNQTTDQQQEHDIAKVRYDTSRRTRETSSTTKAGFSFVFGLRRYSKVNDDAWISPSIGMPMVSELDEKEELRRQTYESMTFVTLHEELRPARLDLLPFYQRQSTDSAIISVDQGGENEEHADNQIEDERSTIVQCNKEDDIVQRIQRKSRESTAVLEECDFDEQQYELIRKIRKDRQQSALEEEEVEVEEVEDDVDADELLNFDDENLTASVRKLVLRIENASATVARNDTLLVASQHGAVVSSCVSNQDEDEYHSYSEEKPDLVPSTIEEDCRRMVAEDAMRAAQAQVLNHSCYIPMDEVQQDLTASVRRIVVTLQTDSERHTPRIKGRSRGNSCPPLPHSIESTAMTMDTHPSRKKQSTLSRLTPKFFDSFRRSLKRKNPNSYLLTDDELESVEGARWKIVELAFRYGGKHRFYLVQAVNMFSPLIKYGRHGSPHPTRLHCNRCGTLQWQHKRGGLSEAVDLASVLQVLEGRQTAVFRKTSSSGDDSESCSFSIIWKERTLDLGTQSCSHRDWLMSALRTLITYAKSQRQAEQQALEERALLLVPVEDRQSVNNLRFEAVTSPPKPPLLW